MKVGMTYDLREDYLKAGYGEEETAEFDRPSTIDAIEAAIRAIGHQPDRIGRVQSLVERLARGDRWDLVFNIAEGVSGFGRESQVPALLDAYGIPYTFADALAAAVTLHKGVAKHVLRDRGIPTPDFRVVESEADARAVDLPFPLFVKPVAEGTAKGITSASKVRNRAELLTQCRRSLEEFRQPALVETYLPGREVTVGIVGTGPQAKALGTMEIHLRPVADAEVYTYRNKELSEDLCDYTMVEGELKEEAERLSLAAWRALGCRDGGRIDLRAGADGHLQVLEANPLPGLHPTHSDLPMIAKAVGIDFTGLVRRIVDSALERVPAAKTPAPARR